LETASELFRPAVSDAADGRHPPTSWKFEFKVLDAIEQAFVAASKVYLTG